MTHTKPANRSFWASLFGVASVIVLGSAVVQSGILNSRPAATICPSASSSVSAAPSTGPAYAIENLSAYDLWLAAGNKGTTVDFTQSLVGTLSQNGYIGSDGVNGAGGSTGASAYQHWLNAGNVGSSKDFLTTLLGESDNVPAATFTAYDLWLSAGNVGTHADFEHSLTGSAGTNGSEGKSAYALWVANGNAGGSTAQFFASLHSMDLKATASATPSGC